MLNIKINNIKKINDKNRACFLLLKNKYKVTAGGLLIHNKQNNKYLLQYNYNKNRWDDFGGKVDWGDNNIFDTIIRETYEESNYLIANKNNKINFNKCSFYYIKDCKYFLTIIDSNNIKICGDLLEYGEIEQSGGYKRKLEWININNKNKINLNGRLKYYFNKKYIKISIDKDKNNKKWVIRQ